MEKNKAQEFKCNALKVSFEANQIDILRVMKTIPLRNQAKRVNISIIALALCTF